MGAVRQEAERDLYETGAEPEYTVNGIPKYEEAGNGLVRIYVCSSRKGYDKLEYTILASPDTFSRLGRIVMTIADEFRDLTRFRAALLEH